MSYLALYRKFRPATFDEVLGQDHITKTLQNQIINNQIGHAYLFCGTRGTGKTSIARIFAKAVNCEKSDKGNPCCKCEVCQHLDVGNIDVIELDGASNNGVDEIRDIKEKVNYVPAKGRYKVYIIDEVHMLTSSAFNALLKTLEEPPKHIIFILCTTEVHKLPLTILSRCMRFDFRLIDTDELTGLIKSVYRQVDKEASDEAVTALADAANGSARDALSLADRCLSCSGKLEYDAVTELLGNVDGKSIRELFRYILDGDTANLLVTVKRLYRSGRNMETIATDLATLCRDLLTINLGGGDEIKVPKEVTIQMQKLADRVSNRKLGYCLSELCKLDAQLKYSLNARILLEAALVKLSFFNSEMDIENLEQRIKQLEKNIASNLHSQDKAVLPSSK